MGEHSLQRSRAAGGSTGGDRGAKFPRRLRSREVSHRLPGAGQGAQTALAGLTSSGAQIGNLSQKTPSFAGVSHSPSTATSPSISAPCLPPVRLSPRPWRKGEEGISSTTKLRQKKKKKGKKFLLLRPIPSTDTENQPPNRQSCNSSQDCGVREGCRVRSAAVVGDPGARAPQNRSPKAQSFRQQYLRAPPGSPSAGAARLAVSLPQAVSSSAHARSPSLLPELGSRRSLGEKNVSARTIPFSPPPLAQPGSLLLPRAPARAAPLAPRVSFSAAPASALSSHYSRVARGQEVIRDRPVAASTRKARCRRGAGGGGGAHTRAGRGARRGGLTARSPRPRGGGGERKGERGGRGAGETLQRLTAGAPGHRLGGSVALRDWGWG